MKLEPNQRCNDDYSLWATEEELKLLNNLIKEAKKAAPIEPSNLAYHDKERPVFGQERRKEQRRTFYGRRSTKERRKNCGRRKVPSEGGFIERRK